MTYIKKKRTHIVKVGNMSECHLGENFLKYQ